MIYLVDNTIDGQGASPRELQTVLGKLRPNMEVLMEPFTSISLERVRKLDPSHIILSGQSHPWEDYSAESLAGVTEVIRKASQPILGVCGGHQQIALAFGAPVALMERLEPGTGYEGAKRERGFDTVVIEPDGLFEGLPKTITVWHSHCDEVQRLPPGFRTTATNKTCAIQAMEHIERPLFGVQFHPELFNEEFPDGRRVMENFLDL
ncbi:MAG: gamma-glutamyl-gamma-aminobutyrate hydrolase family protein [bacterium]